MSRQHMLWAFEAAALLELPTANRMLLITLGQHSNPEGNCWPSVPTLCKGSGLSKREVYRTIPQLEETGLLRAERVAGMATKYHLSVDPGAARARPGNGSSRNVSRPNLSPTSATESRVISVSETETIPLHPCHHGTGANESPVPPGHEPVPLSHGTRATESPEPIKEPIKEPSTGFACGDAALMRRQLFETGPAIVARLTGRMNGQARSFLALLLREAHGDCAAVLDALHDAEADRPGEPASWLIAAARRKSGTRLSTHEQIRRDGNLPTFLTAAPHDEGQPMRRAVQ